jgi:hypothetical protein
VARSEEAALALVPTVSAAAEKAHRRRLREDAKSAFAQRIAARWHLNDQNTPRFLCGHLEEINLRHLMPGEHFPYGASGMHFLECMICPKEPAPIKPRTQKARKLQPKVKKPAQQTGVLQHFVKVVTRYL